ncbi:hypothetical protein ACFYXC_32960 [Streptomyces sp. NPDC002701]|uniref:hypothetical protein n=1 Tax=unclassified Streptomyces TaxID=2593676 RepID=UPI00368D4166
MRRGTTARTLFAVLAAVLLALQLSAPTAVFASTFASVHASPPVAAQAEFVTCAETVHSHGPTGPLRTRERIRVADHVPPASARPPLLRDAAAHEDPSHASAPAAHHRTTRSSGAHSTAALQVFRC